MKKIRIAAALMCLLVCVGLFAGCAKSPVVMEYSGEAFTVNFYRYWMSQIKSNYVSSSMDTDEYWDTKYSNGETYEQKMREIVDFNVKINLVCQKLFKDMGLKLDKEEVAKLDTSISDLMASYGSKSALNTMLSKYGINYKMLRQIYEIELKTTTVYDALYAEGGPRAIDDATLDAYYKDNYSRIDMIIIYDTAEYKKDEKGDLIFNDVTGSYEKVQLNEEQSKAKNALADDIMKKLESGADFDELKAAHNEDPQGKDFKDGYYISSNDMMIYGADIIKAVAEMQIGDVKKVDDGNIIYIMKRKELTDKPYKDTVYFDQFENLIDYCEQADFNKYMGELIKNVTVFTEETAKVSVRDAALMNYQ